MCVCVERQYFLAGNRKTMQSCMQHQHKTQKHIQIIWKICCFKNANVFSIILEAKKTNNKSENNKTAIVNRQNSIWH